MVVMCAQMGVQLQRRRRSAPAAVCHFLPRRSIAAANGRRRQLQTTDDTAKNRVRSQNSQPKRER